MMETKSKEQEAFEMIEKGVSEVYTSENFKNYLSFLSKFHDYSFNNTILILSQFPTATLIAGYTSWQKDFKRQVNKGEKAIKILAPYDKTVKRNINKIDENGNFILDSDGNYQQEEIQVKIKRFRIVNVFDVSQTSGEPLPELINDLKGSSDEIRLLIESIKEVCESPITFIESNNDELLKDGAKGYYDLTEDKIIINKDLEDLQIVKTLAHEYSHSLLHKDKRNEKTQSQREIEAESLAFIICNHFGIDTSDYSFGYIASYAQNDQEFLKQTLINIKQSTDKIIENIEPIFERRKQEMIQDLVYLSPLDMEKISTDVIQRVNHIVAGTPIYDYLRSKDIDEDFGKNELNNKVDAIMNSIKNEFPIHYDLYQQNEFYKEAFQESVFLNCHYDIVDPKQDRPFLESSIERQNYLAFKSIANPILNDTAYYIKFSTPGLDDLNIEIIGENRIAISHYYELNGDMMADPDVECIIDKENQLLIPITYQQDNLQVFYTTESRPDMQPELNNFMQGWLNNIKDNRYQVKEILSEDIDLIAGRDDPKRIRDFCKENDIEHMAKKHKETGREER